MSKECRECDYFCGWRDDYTPKCDYDGGYEKCPYNDEAPAKREDNTKIVVDVEFFREYIRETIENTFRNEAHDIAVREISSIVKREYESIVKQLTQEAVAKYVDQQAAAFMAGDITVGGGWMEPTRTLSREAYMTELVQQNMERFYNSDTMIANAKKAAEEEINKFARKIRDDVNASIKKSFDNSVRTALTDNVVNMLMSNENWKRLADSAGRMLHD